MQKSPAVCKFCTAGRESKFTASDMKHSPQEKTYELGAPDHDYLHDKYLPFA